MPVDADPPAADADLNQKNDRAQPEDHEVSTGRSTGLNRKIQQSQPEVGSMPYKEDQVLDQETYQPPTKGTTRAQAREGGPTDMRASKQREARSGDTRAAVLTGVADELIDQYAGALSHPLPRRDRSKLLTITDELLDDGFTKEQILDGLRLLWRNRARCGPGMLPTFVQQAIAESEAGNVLPMNRRARSDEAFAQEAAIAAGSAIRDPFASGGFFGSANHEVIDGQVVNEGTG
ncbi:hypothetical protein [Parafrankia sp. EUN1f]|uniref:hypothetical protein n=1 Tax=Parafrankia sp. EUN1f TaxID=102897 RepID=UPI0018DB9393|nr:hypothetical protein [Parafrankia sp. EUN1f]